MKYKNLIWSAALLFIVVGFSAVAFSDGKNARENEVVNITTAEGEFQSVGTTFYQYTYTKDTIANAANDTLYLPTAMRPVNSDFLITYTITRTNISGTTALACKVEESTYRYSGTTPPTAGWVASLNNLGAAADTDATTATEEEIRIPNAYASSYRFIVDGSGTQSSSYVLRVVLKKKS